MRIGTTDVFTDGIISAFIEPAVLSVRSQLLQEYPDSPDLAGLCDLSVTRLQETYLNAPQNVRNYFNPIVVPIHGELCHTPKIKSEHWGYQHTMAELQVDGYTFYVDPTCSQLKGIVPDVPDYYISTVKPKWFYADKDNPAWDLRFNILNERIRVKHRVMDHYYSSIGIIPFFQYRVWGPISDVIHKLFYRR